ncbi:hypothetical protein [Absidia glauca]|uniref:Uncharacterized protein n=1 Tax=Absidia glauca TaxID=4829 RepID=A0A168RUV0_ABSGL|nr:hypothetical protein [Absidia glauca]
MNFSKKSFRNQNENVMNLNALHISNPDIHASIHESSIHPSPHPSSPEVLSSLINGTILPQLIKYPHQLVVAADNSWSPQTTRGRCRQLVVAADNSWSPLVLPRIAAGNRVTVSVNFRKLS